MEQVVPKCEGCVKQREGKQPGSQSQGRPPFPREGEGVCNEPKNLPEQRYRGLKVCWHQRNLHIWAWLGYDHE